MEYMERFKQEKAIVKSHLGEDFLDEFVEHTDEYKVLIANQDTTGAALLKSRAFETYTTGVFMHGADKARYGELLDGLSNQYALGNDQYPRTLQAAIDVMRRQKKVKEERKQDGKGTDVKVKEEENRESSFAQAVKRCYCCGSTEHLANNCPVRSGKPRNEWYDQTQGVQHHQRANSDGKKSTNEKSNKSGLSGFQQATIHAQKENKETNDEKMRDVIMLDSGTTISLFCNEDLVSDIRESKEM